MSLSLYLLPERSLAEPNVPEKRVIRAWKETAQRCLLTDSTPLISFSVWTWAAAAWQFRPRSVPVVLDLGRKFLEVRCNITPTRYQSQYPRRPWSLLQWYRKTENIDGNLHNRRDQRNYAATHRHPCIVRRWWMAHQRRAVTTILANWSVDSEGCRILCLVNDACVCSIFCVDQPIGRRLF